MEKGDKIFIAGHKGLVGSSCLRIFKKLGYNNIITVEKSQLDLRQANKVEKFILKNKPSIIINAAAKVGGILANKNNPFEFLLENMQIQNNLIASSNFINIKKFIFLGSSCIYPKNSAQPIKEDYLLKSDLEPTNEYYALAKITGVKLCQALNKKVDKKYISLMPTNLYGKNDKYDLENSHVIPAMIKKIHQAKVKNENTVQMWGTGKPLREFLYVDDLAHAIVLVAKNKMVDDLINIGSGKEISIKELALLVKKTIGYKGEILWDNTKPDGTLRKLIDSQKINNLGWKPKTNLLDGLKKTYNYFLKEVIH